MRLLMGLVRRNRGGLLMWIWLVPSTMNIFVKEDLSVGWLMAGSMGLAFLLGAQTGEGVGCREHRILPVTDRDLWVTKWLNATLVVPLFLLIVKGVGVAVTAGGGKVFMQPETLLLSTLYDIVYAGAVVALPQLIPTLTGAAGRRIDRYSLPVGSPQRRAVASLTVTLVVILVPLYFLLGTVGPMLFARQLPARLADLSTTGTLLLVSGLVMSAAALIWTPPRGGAPPAQRAVSSVPATSAQAKAVDRLTGVLAVVWTHIKSTFVLTAVGMGLVMAAFPFLPPREFNARFLAGLFLIFAFMGISMFSVWAPWMRRLKVLPLSVRQVTALIVLTPLVTWVEIWLMVLLVHAALGLPIHVELSPMAVLAYAGLCALSHALGLWLMGSVAGQTAASMLGMLSAVGAAMLLFEAPGRRTQLLLLVIGLSSLAVAALINHYTLTRSTSSARAYRPLGISMRP
jgi:hypothetical protein